MYCVELLKVPTLMCDFDIKSLSIDHNCNIIPLFFWFLLDKIDMNKLTPEIVLTIQMFCWSHLILKSNSRY